MGSRYRLRGSGETISVDMGRFTGLSDFASQIGALHNAVGMAVRELAESFSDVDFRLVRVALLEEVDLCFSGQNVPRTTAFDVFDRLGEVELHDVDGRLASVLSEELDHEQAGDVAGLWDSHLDTHGSLTSEEQIGLAVKYLRDRGGLRDVAYLLDDLPDEADRE